MYTKLTQLVFMFSERLLQQFVGGAAALYGNSFMRFNVHQLLHLTKAAREMGPLWAHSTFVFEGGNGRLLKLVTAAKGIPLQIVERVVVCQELDLLLEVQALPKHAKDIAKKMLGDKTLQSASRIGEVCLLGTPKRFNLNASEQEAIVRVFGSCPEDGSEYRRFTLKKQVYHSTSYVRAKKSNSTFICTAGRDYYRINRIVTVSVEQLTRCVLLCTEVVIMEEGRLSSHIRECFLSGLDIQNVVVPNEIKGPALFMCFQFDDTAFISDLPNSIERD